MPLGTIICVVLLLWPAALCAEPAHRLAQIRAVKQLYGLTAQLAELQFEHFKKTREEASPEALEKITAALDRQNDVHVLAEFASLLRAGHGGLAEDHVVDNVFDDAWFAAIFRIEKTGGKAALGVLQDMRSRGGLDAGYSETVAEAIRRLERRQQSR